MRRCDKYARADANKRDDCAHTRRDEYSDNRANQCADWCADYCGDRCADACRGNKHTNGNPKFADSSPKFTNSDASANQYAYCVHAQRFVHSRH